VCNLAFCSADVDSERSGGWGKGQEVKVLFGDGNGAKERERVGVYNQIRRTFTEDIQSIAHDADSIASANRSGSRHGRLVITQWLLEFTSFGQTERGHLLVPVDHIGGRSWQGVPEGASDSDRIDWVELDPTLHYNAIITHPSFLGFDSR